MPAGSPVAPRTQRYFPPGALEGNNQADPRLGLAGRTGPDREFPVDGRARQSEVGP